MNAKTSSIGVGKIVRQLRKSMKMTLPELADHIDGYDSGNLSRFERDVQGISEDKLQAIGRFFGYTVSELYAMAEQGLIPSTNNSKVESNAVKANSIEAWNNNTPLEEDEVEVPFLTEVELAAGAGAFETIEYQGPKLRFAKSTIKGRGVAPNHAVCVNIAGNSMEPVLPDGSTVGIDTSNTRIVDGKMYAINHDGLLRIKMLYRAPGGGMRLRSFNTDEHPDEVYSGTQLEHIRVIGRIFWYSVLL